MSLVPEYLDRDQIAKTYGLDPRRLLPWAKAGRFPKPALRISQRVYRWLRADVEKFVREQRSE